MKRISLLIFALLWASALCYAQVNRYGNVRRFEGEAAIGIIFEAERGYGKAPGFSGLIEGRWNIPGSRWDLGAQLFAGRWKKHYGPIADGGPNPYIETMKPLTFTIFGDYNFRQGRDVSIFVGHGPGLTYLMDNGPFRMNRYLAFSTRAGVELRRRYRLTFDYKIIGDKARIFGIGAGYVFGGGLK